MATEFLSGFKVGIFRFILEAGAKGMELPPFYGSTLRGAFGGAFKRIACANPGLESCHKCDLEQACPYAYIFETSPPPGTDRLNNYEDIPRPFMLCPKLQDKTSYKAGERFAIELRLFGKGNDYFPYFILAFIKMGEVGLGFRRKPFRLHQVIALNPLRRLEQVVFERENNKVHDLQNILSGKDLFAYSKLPAEQVRMNLVTPLRLKENGKLVTSVEFNHLARSLMRRASALMLFHHGVNAELKYTELAEHSRKVKRVADFSHWFDLPRYSQRQGEKMMLGGLVGEVTYQGDLGEFIPLLEFGRWAGVGKNNVFGLGQMDYMIETM